MPYEKKQNKKHKGTIWVEERERDFEQKNKENNTNNKKNHDPL